MSFKTPEDERPDALMWAASFVCAIFIAFWSGYVFGIKVNL